MSHSYLTRLACLLMAGGLFACQPTTAAGPTGAAPVAGAAVDAEACEHLTAGPAVAVVGTTIKGDSSPQVNESHRRYDVTLGFIEGKYVGTVRYQSGKAGDYVVYVNDDVPMSVQNANLQAVALEASARSSASCPTVKGRHVVPLGIGTHYLTFGPTDKQKVGFVIEAAADAHGH